jgi:hypothetical protein
MNAIPISGSTLVLLLLNGNAFYTHQELELELNLQLYLNFLLIKATPIVTVNALKPLHPFTLPPLFHVTSQNAAPMLTHGSLSATNQA